MEPTAQSETLAGSLESALEGLDAGLAEAAKSLKTATQAFKKAQEASRLGNLRDLNRLLSSAAAAADDYLRHIRGVGAAWTFEINGYVGSDAHLDELKKAAEQMGLRGARVIDNRLYCYPNIIRADPRDFALRIGKKKHTAVRPSHVAAVLKAAQDRPAQTNLAPLLNAIEQAYLLVTKGELGHAVPLIAIHETLTLLPGVSKDYSLEDLTMDIYRLDLNGPHVTKENRRFDLPASTSTRGGKGIRFATRDGEEKLYSAIRFLVASA